MIEMLFSKQVGQSLSVRPDICPQEYLDEFSGLQVRGV